MENRLDNNLQVPKATPILPNNIVSSTTNLNSTFTMANPTTSVPRSVSSLTNPIVFSPVRPTTQQYITMKPPNLILTGNNVNRAPVNSMHHIRMLRVNATGPGGAYLSHSPMLSGDGGSNTKVLPRPRTGCTILPKTTISNNQVLPNNVNMSDKTMSPPGIFKSQTSVMNSSNITVAAKRLPSPSPVKIAPQQTHSHTNTFSVPTNSNMAFPRRMIINTSGNTIVATPATRPKTVFPSIPQISSADGNNILTVNQSVTLSLNSAVSSGGTTFVIQNTPGTTIPSLAPPQVQIKRPPTVNNTPRQTVNKEVHGILSNSQTSSVGTSLYPQNRPLTFVTSSQISSASSTKSSVVTVPSYGYPNYSTNMLNAVSANQSPSNRKRSRKQDMKTGPVSGPRLNVRPAGNNTSMPGGVSNASRLVPLKPSTVPSNQRPGATVIVSSNSQSVNILKRQNMDSFSQYSSLKDSPVLSLSEDHPLSHEKIKAPRLNGMLDAESGLINPPIEDNYYGLENTSIKKVLPSNSEQLYASTEKEISLPSKRGRKPSNSSLLHDVTALSDANSIHDLKTRLVPTKKPANESKIVPMKAKAKIHSKSSTQLKSMSAGAKLKDINLPSPIKRRRTFRLAPNYVSTNASDSAAPKASGSFPHSRIASARIGHFQSWQDVKQCSLRKVDLLGLSKCMYYFDSIGRQVAQAQLQIEHSKEDISTNCEELEGLYKHIESKQASRKVLISEKKAIQEMMDTVQEDFRSLTQCSALLHKVISSNHIEARQQLEGLKSRHLRRRSPRCNI